MAKRKSIPPGVDPSYPSDDTARSHAFDQYVAIDQGENPRTYFQRHQVDAYLDILHCWGVNGIFFVFSFPPAGFRISKPEDVLKLKTFEGWIFEKKKPDLPMNLLVKASRDGYDFFWREHARHSH